jgi:hypothetical protein
MVSFAEQNGPIVIPYLLTLLRDRFNDVERSPTHFPDVYIQDDKIVDLDIEATNAYLRAFSRILAVYSVIQSVYMQSVLMQSTRATAIYTVPFSEPDNVDLLRSIGHLTRYPLEE